MICCPVFAPHGGNNKRLEPVYQTFLFFMSELVNSIGWGAAFHFVALKHQLMFDVLSPKEIKFRY
jgi:hypothetical protein